MQSRKLKKLFEPIRVGGVDLKNRLLALGIATGLGKDYRVTDKLIDFYCQLAKGGVGLMIVGSVYPSDFSSAKAVYPPNNLGLGIWNDEFIPELRELTNVVHNNGSRIACQLGLSYEWRASKDAQLEGIGASTGPGGPWHKNVRGLTVSEIHQIINEFGEAARRSREAGFDMIEFGAAGGYLISRFLSPSSNKRTDEYGGSFENRNRFFLEIIDSCKKKAGADFTYICRMQTDQYMPGGTTIEDAKLLAVVLENAGIAALNTHHGWHESPKPVIPQWVKPDEFIQFAAEIKSVVNIPVCASIRIENALIAERILAEGKADLVGMARALVADRELPNKSRDGKFSDIRPCIVCGRCHDNVFSGLQVACSVDGSLGKEDPKPITKQKKVLVIGGGPAGMEAARVAALRGHEVTLCEKGRRLGGLMILGRILNEKLEPLVDYMRREIEKLPIKVKLRTEVTAAFLDELNPDAVILAAGGMAIIPEVPGIKRDNVISGHELADLFINDIPIKKGILLKLGSRFARYFSKPSFIRRLFSLNFPIGKRVAIIGGQFAGCEMAQALIGKGKEITIIEESDSLGTDIGSTTRWGILRMLKEAGVKMLNSARLVEINEKGVIINRSNTTECIEVDTVILAQGVKPDIRFPKELEGKASAIYNIGDCAGSGRIREAINSGFDAGCSV